MRVRTPIAALLALTVMLATAVGASAAPGDVTSVDLELVGQSALPSVGLDGQTKPRGQNGDIAVDGDTAFVAGGALFSGVRSSPGRICTDYGGVKVVDIANPANPNVITQIDVEDTKGVLTAPLGNPRRNQFVKNVASSVSAVDVIRHPVANKTILAFATQRCEQSFFTGARIEFWDVTNRATPSRVGVFDPETVLNTGCTPGPPVSCPPGTSPQTAAFGIFEDVEMFVRNTGPGGSPKVFAVATTPFSGDLGRAAITGDFKVIDLTDPANAQQVATFGGAAIGQSSNNGCRIFEGARSVAPTPDGARAIVSWYDGIQPNPVLTPNSQGLIPTLLGGPTDSSALLNLDLDNVPQPSGSATSPPVGFTPNPPTWGYPTAPDGGETPAGEVEGNASDVEPFLGADGKLLTWVSEEDADPAITRATIDGPPEADYAGRACETLFADKLYLRANQEFDGGVAYVGRGCPASPLDASTNRIADPYLEDPAGKIAVLDSGGSLFDGCSFGAKTRRATAAGATAVVGSIGADVLNLFIPGPDGGVPAIPSVALQATAFDRLAGYAPNRVLSGATFPANFIRSSTSNVLLKPLGVAISAATNASPIVLTAANNGLVTGDRVTVRNARGNTAANGNYTVSVTGNSVTLQGSAGNGAYTGAGYLVQCPASDPNCSAPDVRTDASRYRHVADATDRTARAQMNPTFVTTTADAAAQATSIAVAPLPAALPTGTALRFSNATFGTLSAPAAAGATSISVGALARAIPSGSVGSVLARVTAGESYSAGGVFEVQARTDGAFGASVVWYNAAGGEISAEEFTPAGGLNAVSARTYRSKQVTAPAGAVRAALRAQWTGANAEGVAFSEAMYLRPTSLQVKLRDQQDRWGAQRIIDFSLADPAEIGTFRSPRSTVWPPPNDGVYAPSQARMLTGTSLAFTTWHSDGLQVVDVKTPTTPRLVGSYVPPDVADPSDSAGAGPTDREGQTGSLQRGDSWPNRALVTGVEVISKGPNEALVALSDINAGLYLVRARINREAGPTATVTPAPTYVIPTPTPTPSPYPIARKRPGLSAKARPKRDKRKPFVFKVSGQLKRPSGVGRSAGCKGTVVITAKKGKKTIAKRRTGIKSTCKYKARVKLRKSAGRRGKVKFQVRFLGNNRLKTASARTSARYGR